MHLFFGDAVAHARRRGGDPYAGCVRRLLSLVCAIVFVDAMLFGALTPLLPSFARELDLSKAGAGLLVAAFGAGALLGGVPGGLLASRLGPKRAVAGGLVLLAAASLAFALAGDAWSLGAARLVQGFSSTLTWAGALAWIAVATPRSRRGEAIGTTFGAAVAGAILGPMLGGVAHAAGVRPAFLAVAAVALSLSGLAALGPDVPAERLGWAGLARAVRDRRFLGALWLQTLPAMLFGVLVVLAPLALDESGWTALAIAALFVAAGLAEVVVNPLLGRVSDRIGRLLPVQAALAASTAVTLALALGGESALLAALVFAAALSFGALYTPSMALASDRAELAGLAQGLAFGLVNSAWAAGELVGPSLGGYLAETHGDAAPWALGALLCALTLTASLAQRERGAAAREA